MTNLKPVPHKGRLSGERQTQAAAPVFRVPRPSVDLSARLVSARRDNEVRILNLSSRGALVRGGRGIAVGEKIKLCRGDFSLPAEVRWARGARFGIAFDELLDSASMARFMQAIPEDKRDTRGLLRLFRPR
jgi:hypothetical protein